MNPQQRDERASAALRNLLVRRVTGQAVAPALPVAETMFRPEMMVPQMLPVPEPAPLDEATEAEAADAVESLVREASKALPHLLDPRRAEEEIAMARLAAVRVAQGQLLEGEPRLVFEAVVRLADRPVFDVVNGSFGAVTPEWTVLEKHKTRLEAAFGSVGRIELMSGVDEPYAGTGFVVGPNLLMTNRHVAEIFSTGVGRGDSVQLRWTQEVTLDLHRENVSPRPPRHPLRVRSVKLIHPYFDAAVLEVEGLEERGIRPLPLAAAPPSQSEFGVLAHGRSVAIIGFPASSPEHPLDVQKRVFRNVFGVKRLQPGIVTGARSLRWLGRDIVALAHDSSTLGGNSGSAVIDLETGLVIALHFSGAYLVNNFGVMAWELSRDPIMRELGVRFEAPPDAVAMDDDAPSWLGVWQQTTHEPAAHKENVSPKSPVLPAAPDWFERTSDAELLAAMHRDPETTCSLIRATLNEDEANELIVDLRANGLIREIGTMNGITEAEGVRAEGLLDGFFPRPDPDLPDVVMLHGIMGGHLASPNGLWPRVWLHPTAFIEGNLAERLALSKDGERNVLAGLTLRADGHVRLSYQRTVRALQKSGFVVHSFSFDWRKNLGHSADRLELFLQNLRLERPGREQTILAHSMGGLVAALWAHRHPASMNGIQRAVFLGSPLGGSYAPVQAVLGTYDNLRKIALLSRHDDLSEMRRMSCTFPGLLEMLPDPALFADAEPLYRSETWPAGFVPLQEWLNSSLQVKTLVRQSPLLERTTMLASLEHGTVAALAPGWIEGTPLAVAGATGAGDGTVPGQATVLEGLRVFEVRVSHGLLPRDPAVLAASSALLAGDEPDLPSLSPTDVARAKPRPETPFAEAQERVVAQARRERFERGIWSQSDWDWLVGA